MFISQGPDKGNRWRFVVADKVITGDRPMNSIYEIAPKTLRERYSTPKKAESEPKDRPI
jgi:hypothetical protein